MVQIERLSAEDFTPESGLVYLDVADLHGLYKKLEFTGNHILVGPKGVAKTLSVAAYAASIEAPIITFDCSEDVRRSQLIGMFVLRGDQTPFVLGPLTTAFEVANEVGRCILVLEEINALTPTMQKILNPATDFRKKIEVPEAQKVFRLKNGAKLWVVGTMNFSAYGGVYALNEDLKSRFRLITVGYPDPKDEKRVVEEIFGKKVEELDKLVDHTIRLAHETRQKALEYALSPRDVVQILEDILLVGEEKALRIAVGKFEGDDRTTVKKRIESIFGIKMIKGKGRASEAF
jgi:nitric oxide reductase NorQ protein